MNELLSFINWKWLASTWGVISGAVGGVVGYVFGGCAESIAWLFAIMLIDFTLGTLCACKKQRWNSHECRNGMVSKFFILAICAGGYGLDHVAHTTFIQSAFIAAFAFAEFGSCLENIECLGYGYIIPQTIRDLLSKMKSKPL